MLNTSLVIMDIFWIYFQSAAMKTNKSCNNIQAVFTEGNNVVYTLQDQYAAMRRVLLL